jgi:hypothetical protein
MAIRLSASREPVGDRAVVFACDGQYARFAMVAAEQIARLHPERDFDICLCYMDERPPEPPGLARLGIRYCRLTTDDLFDGLRLDAGRTQVVYLRLALPEALARDYRRLLYLDADVFVQRGDFRALMAVDLGPHPIAAVRDNAQWRTPRRRPRQFRRLGIGAAPYFNAGVMLIDVAGYTDAGVLERCVEIGRAHSAVMIRHDQNLLNAVLRGDWAELSPLWNWQYTWASRLTEAMEDANIVHFIGPRKPWNHDRGEFPLRFRRAYRAFMAEHFPDQPVGPDGTLPHANRAFLRKMLVKHLWSLGRTCDYLDRFPDDLTVIRRPLATGEGSDRSADRR